METIDLLVDRAYRLFTDFYGMAWDLGTRLTRVKRRIEDLSQSYRRTFERTKLVLYPKRKQTWMEPSGLHWGMTIPGLRSGPMRGDGRRVRRIKHLAGPLNDSTIHFGGGNGRRRLLYDFDRRRLAVNAAHRAITYATMTTLKALRGRARKLAAPRRPTPLPPLHCRRELRESGAEALDPAWRLVAAIVNAEIGLYSLTREFELARSSTPIDLRFEPTGGCLGGPRCAWHLWEVGRVVEKLTYDTLRRARLPVDRHRRIAEYEKRRRKLEKERARHAKLFMRLKRLWEEACEEADRCLEESKRVLVDEYDRPIERRTG